MDEERYTPERVRAILRKPREYTSEEKIDVGSAVERLIVRGDVGGKVLLLWAMGFTQAESLKALGVKGDAHWLFVRSLRRVAKELGWKK